MNDIIKNLTGVNARKLKLVGDVAKRVISKTQSTLGKDVVSEKIDDEQFTYLIDQAIEKSLRLKNTSTITISKENKELGFKSGGLLETINDGSPEARTADIDEMGVTYAKSVSNFIGSVKNNVIPAMDKMSECILSSLDLNSTGIHTGYNLITLNIPLLFTNLEEHGGLTMLGNGELPIASTGLPLPEIEDIRNWFITDSEDINYDAENYLASTTDEELLKIWEKYFLDFSASNVFIKDLSLLHFTKVKELVLLYCAIKNLTVKTPDFVTNLATFKSSVINMFDYIKYVISKYVKFYELYAETKVVQNIRIVGDVVNIYTFDKAYETFSQKSVYGVDAILGFAIDNRDTIDVSNVSITVERLLEVESEMHNVQQGFIDFSKLNAVKENSAKHIYAYKVMSTKIYNDIVKELPVEVSEDLFKSIYDSTVIEIEKSNSETDVELFSLTFFGNLFPRVKRFFTITQQTEKISNDGLAGLKPKEIALYSTLELIVLELLDEVYVRDIVTYKV